MTERGGLMGNAVMDLTNAQHEQLGQLALALWYLLLCERRGEPWQTAADCGLPDVGMRFGLVGNGLAVGATPALRPQRYRLTALGRQRARDTAEPGVQWAARDPAFRAAVQRAAGDSDGG